MLNWPDIISLRMQRQYLATPVGRENYDQLFSAMSPVPTMYWTAPGNPPTLPGHVDFDDYDYNMRRRVGRRILKGRFAGGCIAYVTEEDLELYACLFRREVRRYSYLQRELTELLREEGPLNIQQMKELTGLKVKVITSELHKLQEAFIVYEDQVDNEGDRGWYLFESEFPEVDLNRYTRKEALKLAVPRAVKLLVFFDEKLLQSYYRLPGKLIFEAVEELAAEGRFLPLEVENRKGYILPEDRDYLLMNDIKPYIPGVMLLQRNDFLVRAYSDTLKEQFHSDWETLYYILADGTFHGVVVGKFKFGPHVIEDIILDLSEAEKKSRQAEILEAVYEVFDGKKSPVKRYGGKEGSLL